MREVEILRVRERGEESNAEKHRIINYYKDEHRNKRRKSTYTQIQEGKIEKG